MQIVIDIDESLYKFICGLSCEDSERYDDVVLTAVKNGTVVNDDEWMKKADNIAKLHKRDALEDVRAEIESLDEGITSYHHDRPWVYKDEVLSVIDKHLRGE